MAKRKVVEDIVSDECDGRYCLLKEIMAHSGMRDYILEQYKCVEKFKFEESKHVDRDIGWEEAMKLWIQRGFAKRYAEVYSDSLSFNRLYTQVVRP
jgi:hypothetical protein